MKRILIVDDDIHIGNMLEEALVRDSYAVMRAYSGTEAKMLLKSETPDLVLLDLMLPGMDGEELLPLIKGIPVIVVSAKIGVDSKVDMLLSGAADYVTKPFDLKELLARIAVQLRRSASPAEREITVFEDIALDTLTRTVTVREKSVKLTRTEYAILKQLMENPNAVIAKSVLLERISNDTPDCTEDSLKVHISNLRKKLFEATGKNYIEAVWGIGFKLCRGNGDGKDE